MPSSKALAWDRRLRLIVEEARAARDRGDEPGVFKHLLRDPSAAQPEETKMAKHKRKSKRGLGCHCGKGVGCGCFGKKKGKGLGCASCSGVGCASCGLGALDLTSAPVLAGAAALAFGIWWFKFRKA